jgi:hypothetical protein
MAQEPNDAADRSLRAVLVQRRAIELCGRAFAIVRPLDEEGTERDKLCPACPALPPAPQGTEDQPA